MSEFLEVMLSFPTVVFTVMLALSVIYWLFVILGALDMDLLGSADGAADGVADGVVDGAVDGALDAGVHGAEGALHGVEHAVDGAAHAVHGGGHGAADGLAGADGSAEAAGGFLSALKLRRVPVTVSFSLFSAFSWLFSCLTMQTAGPALADLSIPTWVLGIPAMLIVSFVALMVTSLAVRPLGKLFHTHVAGKSQTDLVGKVCVVSTGRVDDKFGQANLEDGGAGLILQVRARPGNGIKRGDRVLIIGWDEKLGGFNVEPMKDLMPDSSDFEAAAREMAATEEAVAAEVDAKASSEAKVP